jgi:hypothetical protein
MWSNSIQDKGNQSDDSNASMNKLEELDLKLAEWRGLSGEP